MSDLRFILLFNIALAGGIVVDASAESSPNHKNRYRVQDDVDSEYEYEHSALERHIAQEIISSGRMLEDNPHLDGVVRFLARQGAEQASRLLAMTDLELEYTLSEDGHYEYSILAVQPFYESASLRHNIFGQASYSNRKVEDIETGTESKRDTINAGLGYSYVTPDRQQKFGVNAFIDHDFDYNHNRMSVGLDYKNALIGAHLNRYFGLSDWKSRGDGFGEKALSGTDFEISGRLPSFPQLELFARAFNWEQKRTAVFGADGNDIWGYEASTEFTPVDIFTLRAAVIEDNMMNNVSGEITFRLNYTFGDDIKKSIEPNKVNLTNVLDHRFDKVRRQNDIRVQVRHTPDSGSSLDTTPDAFNFTDRAGIPVSTLTTSNTITISGINTTTPVSVTGDGTPQVQINGGSWVTSGNIENGDTLAVRLTSNAANSTTNTATINVGGVTDDWNVTTTNKVICGQLYTMGYLPYDIYHADQRYAQERISEGALRAYGLWGAPIARLIDENDTLLAVVRPFATAWAEHMAYEMGVRKEDNLLGNIMQTIFLPLHEFAGRILFPGMEKPLALSQKKNAESML